MRTKRWLFTVVSIAALSLVMAACGGDKVTTPKAADCSIDKLSGVALGGATTGKFTTAGRIHGLRAQAKPVVRVGFIGDLTGSNSALVTHARDAAKLAFKLASQDATVPVTIELVAKDNKEASPDTAPALAQQLIADAKVLGVIGPAFSGETSAVGPLFKDAGLTHVTQSATRADLTAQGWTTFFRGVGGDVDQAAAAGKLLDAIGCKNVAVVNDKSAYGQGYAEIAKKALIAGGVTVALDEGITPTTDYTTLVDSLLTKQPDAVIYAGYVAEGPLVLKQMRAKGLKALFLCGDGCKEDKFVTDAGPDAEGALFTCPCLDPNVSSDPAAQDFVAKFTAEYNRPPGIYGAEGWDAAQIFIAAFKDGKTDRAGVLDFVTNLKDFTGITKTFNWTTDATALHEVVDKGVNIYGIRGGKINLLGPIQKFAP